MGQERRSLILVGVMASLITLGLGFVVLVEAMISAACGQRPQGTNIAALQLLVTGSTAGYAEIAGCTFPVTAIRVTAGLICSPRSRPRSPGPSDTRAGSRPTRPSWQSYDVAPDSQPAPRSASIVGARGAAQRADTPPHPHPPPDSRRRRVAAGRITTRRRLRVDRGLRRPRGPPAAAKGSGC
jgi:hypothetical protein